MSGIKNVTGDSIAADLQTVSHDGTTAACRSIPPPHSIHSINFIFPSGRWIGCRVYDNTNCAWTKNNVLVVENDPHDVGATSENKVLTLRATNTLDLSTYENAGDDKHLIDIYDDYNYKGWYNWLSSGEGLGKDLDWAKCHSMTPEVAGNVHSVKHYFPFPDLIYCTFYYTRDCSDLNQGVTINWSRPRVDWQPLFSYKCWGKAH